MNRETGTMMRLTPVVKFLLLANIAIYFLDLLVFDFKIREFGAFTIGSAIHEGRFWEFITFQFIHGSVGHLLMNSMALYFFGPWMERWWGTAKSFLLFYLASGAAGAGFFMLLAYAGVLPGNNLYAGLVGASAGIYGILVGVAIVAPALHVQLLFPPISLSMKQLALGVVAIAIGIILFQIGSNEGGEAGHLGGAIMGGILVWLWRPDGWIARLSPSKAKRRNRDYRPKIRPRTVIDLDTSTIIDDILDKISREGFQSLTDEEKQALQDAADRKQDGA